MPSGKKRKRHKVATHKRKKKEKIKSPQEKIVFISKKLFTLFDIGTDKNLVPSEN